LFRRDCDHKQGPRGIDQPHVKRILQVCFAKEFVPLVFDVVIAAPPLAILAGNPIVLLTHGLEQRFRTRERKFYCLKSNHESSSAAQLLSENLSIFVKVFLRGELGSFAPTLSVIGDRKLLISLKSWRKSGEESPVKQFSFSAESRQNKNGLK
jgi:hypothetical protein